MSLGSQIVFAMSKLSLDEWKFSLMNAFQKYEEEIYNDEPRTEPWLFFLDLVALHWGYYGDLDIYIKTMEQRLSSLMVEIKTKAQADEFIKAVGDYKEQHDKEVEEMRKHFED